ncbi:pao retrotransposon peptidase domain-containing protein [Phthorimaea operculella]|nr:pao retrotransposon peptidase domain-containing protein [Phthorimaea operculella]
MNRSGDAGGSAGSDQRREPAHQGREQRSPPPPRRSPPPHRSQGQAGGRQQTEPTYPRTWGRSPPRQQVPDWGRTAQERGHGHPSQVRDPTGGCQESTRQPPGYMQYSAGLSHLVGSQDPRMPPPMPEYPRLQAQPRYGRLPLGYYRAPAMAFMGRPPYQQEWDPYTASAPRPITVLLPTAKIWVWGYGGRTIQVRALLDTGAQGCIVSSKLVSRLGLNVQPSADEAVGIGGLNVPDIRGQTNFEFALGSTCTGVSYQVSAVVLDEVVGKLPQVRLPPTVRGLTTGLELADPDFDTPGTVDVLLGSDVLGRLWCGRKKVLQEAGLVAVDTTGGYVVFGPVWRPQDLPEGDTVLYGSVLSEVLQRFWESEEPPTADRRKPEDDECELFYQYNTARCPVEQALILRDELIAIMGSGGYELRKWLSSCPELLAGLPGEFHQDPHLFENPDNPNTLGILGVQNRPTHDVFTYKIEPDLLEKTWTKRSVLSTIARTFDPNGWIAPVTFMAKCFLQRLWLANLGWDDQLSGELLKDWLKFVTTLPGIVHIAIPRKLVPSAGCKATLHGFCDASERGYAAAVYLRTASSTGTVHVRLVMAKSKVAPVRTRWTIPKLELAGAALLARLLNHVTCNLRGTINLDETVYAWTDSRIVLCWLQTSVHTLEVFVANRVSQITGSETPLVWRHVPGEWNPADCASRGCRAPDLVSHPLWWGPQWLTESPKEWPFNECRAPLGPPDRGLRVNVGQLVPNNPAFLLERYSSLDKLLGVTGWIKRFVNNCRKPQAERNFTPVLSPAERNAALCSLVRVVQAEHFEEEVRLLRDGRGKLKGGIVRLNPFLDEQGPPPTEWTLFRAPSRDSKGRRRQSGHFSARRRATLTEKSENEPYATDVTAIMAGGGKSSSAICSRGAARIRATPRGAS